MSFHPLVGVKTAVAISNSGVRQEGAWGGGGLAKMAFMCTESSANRKLFCCQRQLEVSRIIVGVWHYGGYIL